MKKEYYIKNMVCSRCIKVLRNELLDGEVDVLEVVLGKIVIKTTYEDRDKIKILKVLHENGFELLDAPATIISERVKIELINLFNVVPMVLPGKLSDYLVQKTNMDYSKISKVFSSTENITIEKYFIKLKIEKVKELIQANEYNFTEIGQLLDYNNVNYLSRQFKSETGMNLTEYKGLSTNFRNSLDQII
ncbi:helix-turn-helix protein [Gillisia sp. Hel_I_86]|uniref:helix-turn-helix domain-containing protein n=1 Tax=Gillisia sp. Hel_I_86 TaxID=1249981 RepID=UPI001198F43E|nr:helix-turn-helix domain-containing protein [Gillisia sp. Hel_I_86]TVZ26846.1 helix-turn-helix protein [Gillisia sp. Hel_I_86]